MAAPSPSGLLNQTFGSLAQPNQSSGYRKLDYRSKEFRVISIALTTAIVISNVLVLVLYILKKNLRSKKNFLLISLAISDLFAGAVVLPLHLTAVENPSNMDVRLASALCFRFLAISTILHILVITLEKYFIILYPFFYKGVVLKKHLRCVSASIWFVAFAVAFSPATWLRRGSKSERRSRELVYFSVIGIILFLLPLASIVFAQVRMFQAISKSVVLAENLRRFQLTSISKPLALERSTSTATTSTSSLQYTTRGTLNNRKALCAFALMLSTFLVCWSTWYVGVIMSCLRRQPLSFLTPALYNAILTLVFLPSFINPLLYTYYKHDFRQALCSCFKRRNLGNVVVLKLQVSTLTIATPSSR